VFLSHATLVMTDGAECSMEINFFENELNQQNNQQHKNKKVKNKKYVKARNKHWKKKKFIE
jgi:hypothetical protein